MDDEFVIEVGAFPIDVSTLHKGMVISEKQCEEMTGTNPAHSRYPFELMRVRQFIMNESERTGTPLSVAIRGNALVINTDAQASQYHAKLCKAGERSIHRNLYHLIKTVDSSKLTSHEAADHQRRVAIWSMKAARLRSKGLPVPEAQPRIEV